MKKNKIQLLISFAPIFHIFAFSRMFAFPNSAIRKTKLITTPLSLALICGAIGCEQHREISNPSNIPIGWRPLSLREQSNIKIEDVLHSKQTWCVSKLDSEVNVADSGRCISKHNPLITIDSTTGFQINTNKFYTYKQGFGGYVAGVDLGEFGGGLFFVDSSLQNLTPINFNEKFDYENVRHIESFGGRIFALCGLAHMGLDSGAMVEIKNMDGKLSAIVVSYLPNAPSVAQKINDSEIVYADMQAIRKIRIDGALEEISTFNLFEFGSPMSIVYDKGSILIGMNRYIVYYDAKSKWNFLLEPIRNYENAR